MSEWPEQRRLTDALHRLADDAEPSEDHRQAILARLLQASSAGSEATPRRGGPLRRVMPGGTRLVPTMSAVALAGLLVVTGLLIADRYLSTTGIAIEAGTAATTDRSVTPSTPGPGDGISAPAPDRSIPEMTPANFCHARPSGPVETEFLLTLDDEQPMAIGVQATDGAVLGPGGISLIDFGDGPDWRDSRWLDVLGPTRIWLTFRVPAVDGVDATQAVIDEIIANTCQTAVFAAIAADVTPAGTVVSCRTPEAGRNLNAVMLIDPPEPPSSCPGSTPTLVVGTDLGDGDAVDAWAAAYGCRGLSTEPLVDDATTVAFDECRHPLALIDLQRPIDDVWTDSGLAGAIIDRLLQLR